MKSEKQEAEKDTGKLRILLAEDHHMVREGLKALINAQPDMDVIAEADNGRTAVQQAKELRPDIVVMDISMPQMSGLQATEKIKQAHPDIKVLTLTRHADTSSMQQLFGAGASGYVLKQSASDELVHAIRTIAIGNNYLDPAITGKVMSGYASLQLRTGSETQSELSEREADVLRMIAWGYSNKEIGTQLNVSVKTVEAHKANFMKKLNFRSRIDIVRYALHKGWLSEE